MRYPDKYHRLFAAITIACSIRYMHVKIASSFSATLPSEMPLEEGKQIYEVTKLYGSCVQTA